jgi:hypothetical protein
MNKKQAKIEAENNTKTWGELLGLVEAADLRGMSRVNKSLTREQVAQIFKDMISGRDLNEVPQGLRFDVYRDCNRISADGLGIQNLLREFA